MASGRGAPGAAVVDALADAGQHHGGIGKHQLVLAALGVLKLMEIETALFGGHALDKGQVGLPVLHQILTIQSMPKDKLSSS